MKLVKSIDNKMLSGVCGGIGTYFGIDAAIVRIAFVVCTIFGFGSPILVYLILSMVMPRESYW